MALSGKAAPFPWSFEFVYPANCAQFLEISPPTIADPNNPVPYDKARGTSIVSGVQISVIWANINPAVGIFTGLPVESAWDGLFEADVIRYLTSAVCDVSSSASLTRPTSILRLLGRLLKPARRGAMHERGPHFAGASRQLRAA